MFTAETYIQRRQALMDRVGKGIILLLGNDEAPMNYLDNTYRYRQDSTFLYYFGLAHADLAAVMDCDTGTVTVIGDELTIDHIVWMGTQPTLKSRCEVVGVKAVTPLRHPAGHGSRSPDQEPRGSLSAALPGRAHGEAGPAPGHAQ